MLVLIHCKNDWSMEFIYNGQPLLFQPISNADFVVPVEIDGTVHQVYVLKRPYVDEFLQRMGELYECVLFTASLAKVRSVLKNSNLVLTTISEYFRLINCRLQMIDAWVKCWDSPSVFVHVTATHK